MALGTRKVRFRALLLVGPLVLPVWIAPAWASATGQPSALPILSTSSSLTPAATSEVCERAAALTAAGEPGAAIKTIMGARTASSAPDAQPTACNAEYNDALVQQARAVEVMTWIAHLQKAAERVEKSTSRVPLPHPVPKGCAVGGLPVTDPNKGEVADHTKEAVEVALGCDARNKEAVALAKSLEDPAPSTRAEVAKKAWEKYTKDWLSPWGTVLVGFLVWALVVAVFARLLLVFLGRYVDEMFARVTRARSVAMWVGWLGVLTSSALAVGLISLLKRRADLDLGYLIIAVVLVGIGVALALTSRYLRDNSEGYLPDSNDQANEDADSRVLVCALAWIGGILVFVGLGVGLARTFQFADTAQLRVWWGVLVGMLAAGALVIGWSAGRVLTITTAGESAPTPEYMRSLIKRLAPDAPRGVESPSGTDAEVLTAVGIIDGSSNPLVAALARLLKVGKPPSPWQLAVTAHSDDALTADLTRNNRMVESVTIERSMALGFLETTSEKSSADDSKGEESGDVAGEASKDLELATFAAALAVVKIASAHNVTEGLAGVKKWRSLAYQYLGSRQPRAGETSKALFAEAVGADPGNKLARVGYWYALYREADDPAEMVKYCRLLERLLQPADSAGIPQMNATEPTLTRRLLFTRAAIGVNLVSAGKLDGDLRKRTDTLLQLATEKSSEVDRDFAQTLQENVTALELSVGDLPGSKREPSKAATKLLARRAEENGPSINYSLACYYASKNAAGLSGLGAKERWAKYKDRTTAANYLKLAVVDPEVSSWHKHDPQLEMFRTTLYETEEGGLSFRTNKYLAEFGEDLPSDVLAIKPFSEHSKELRSAGLVDLQRLSKVSVWQLVGLGLKLAEAGWLSDLAALGVNVPVGLDQWRVALVAEMAAQGLSQRPSGALDRDALRGKIEESFGKYKKLPSEGALKQWLPVAPVRPSPGAGHLAP